MIVYSLGMTLFWSVDYQLPQNQPILLSDNLNNLLLSMCEDTVHRRADLVTVLETCEQHIKAAQLPLPEKLIRQLVQDVFRDSVSHPHSLFGLGNAPVVSIALHVLTSTLIL